MRPILTVRRNYPYNGKDDGLTSWFRRHLPPDAYVGIVELEINQGRILTAGRQWTAICTVIIESLRRALANPMQGFAGVASRTLRIAAVERNAP